MVAFSAHLSSGRRAGLTLVEAVTAIVVLGIALPPLLGLFTGVAQAGASRGHASAALVVAESLMEEIASKAFEDPDGEAGSFGTEEATRLAFDDVDDYDGFAEAPPTRLDGSEIPGLESLSTAVDVRVIDAGTDPYPAGAGSGTSLIPSLEGFKQVRVRVFWPGGDHELLTLRAPGSDPGDGDGSGGGGGVDPEPADGPIDEALATSTAVKNNSRRIRLDIQNETNEYQSMASISLSASGAHPDLSWIRLNGWYLVAPASPIGLPTGAMSLTGLSWADRTLFPNEFLRMRIQFVSGPSGTYDYDLEVVFDDGSVSKIPFTIDW